MPATPARFDFITQEFRVATSGPDSGIVTAYGNLARDVSADEPYETFFAHSDDVAAMTLERYNILRAVRRRFVVTLSAASTFALGLNYTQSAPVGTLIEPKSGANFTAITIRVQINLITGGTTLDMWG